MELIYLLHSTGSSRTFFKYKLLSALYCNSAGKFLSLVFSDADASTINLPESL